MKHKILIIDDDREMCDEVSSSLEDEGYEVSISNDGIEGNELASGDDFDVLLLDLCLPNLGGLDILKGLRDRKCPRHIIVVSGQVGEDRLTKGRHTESDGVNETLALADGVLSKPFSMERLLSMIKEAVQRTRRSESKPGA